MCDIWLGQGMFSLIIADSIRKEGMGKEKKGGRIEGRTGDRIGHIKNRI